MRIIAFLITTIAIPPAHAKIYKCETHGKTSFQQAPCQAAASSSEFVLKKDISIERQQQAVQKLNNDLTEIADEKKLAKEVIDKERIIRAHEHTARATYQNAQANKEQAIQAAKQKEPNSQLYTPYIYKIRPLNTYRKTQHSIQFQK